MNGSINIKNSTDISVEADGIKLKELHERVAYLENYDIVTGLPNRALFIEKVNDIILLQSTGGRNNAILTVDLDNFKKLNDTYGYLVGDELLRIAAVKLKSCVRENDFVARIGGDEFFVLLAGFEDIEHIKKVSGRILSTFNDIWKIINHEFYMTATIGIAIIPEDKPDVYGIMMNAASALIKDVLDRTGMPPSCLEIEITESAIVKSMNTAIHVLTQLRELGIKISLDDFGTGYSSLSYLKTLPVDKIKIDRSFIIDIGKNKKTEAVISGIIMLAKIMNLDVIAEGVETAEQADFLILKGCSDIQGFLYSRPLPEEQFTMLLSDQDVVFEKNSWFYYQI